MNNLIKKLNCLSGGKILDVGIGRGQFAWIMAENLKNYEVIIGLDPSRKNLEKAQKNLQEFNVDYLLGSGKEIPFNDNYFDIVTIAQVLHHIPNKREIIEVLNEMKRVLKPGGMFIVKEMYSNQLEIGRKNAEMFHNWLAKIDRILNYNHFNTYPKNEIIDMVKGVNLNSYEISEYVFDNNQANKFNIFSRIDKKIMCIENFSEYMILKQEGNKIKELVNKYGILSEKEIIIYGTK